MGHHINKQGQFQSDKYPKLAPDKLVLSFKDPAAYIALKSYAVFCDDEDLSEDILVRLQTLQEAGQ